MRNSVLCLLTALVLALTAGRAFAQTFTGMGVAYTYVTGMSADGSVVVGVWGPLGPAWRWTAATGVVDIGSVSQIVAISRDGKTIVGTANDASGIAYAAIWQKRQTMGYFPVPGECASTGWKIDRRLQRIRRRIGHRRSGVFESVASGRLPL